MYMHIVTTCESGVTIFLFMHIVTTCFVQCVQASGICAQKLILLNASDEQHSKAVVSATQVQWLPARAACSVKPCTTTGKCRYYELHWQK
jgi:hypothetical protein